MCSADRKAVREREIFDRFSGARGKKERRFGGINDHLLTLLYSLSTERDDRLVA